jgi:hypothetical protein
VVLLKLSYELRARFRSGFFACSDLKGLCWLSAGERSSLLFFACPKKSNQRKDPRKNAAVRACWSAPAFPGCLRLATSTYVSPEGFTGLSI